jgi:glutamyl-tRNA(Gln) amidotransferase subunit D
LSENDIKRSDDLSGYTGFAAELIQGSEAKSGSRVKIKTNDGLVLTGLLIPRYEEGASDYIVLKLKSGYNVGIEAKSIASIDQEEQPPNQGTTAAAQDTESTALDAQKNLKNLLLLSTGGTIASKVDYRTGAVKPVYTAADLYASVPELGKIANIEAEIVFSTFSENLSQTHWEELSRKIIDSKSSRGSSTLSGIVVMMGTDTLTYVSAALSFSLIGFGLPVVCVGSQRSSDRPSTDSALNLLGAARFAASSNARGVFVAMHESENDNTIAIHSGVRVRKNHTSRRDAFESIDVPLYAKVQSDKISFASDYNNVYGIEGLSSELALKTKFDQRIALIKFYPGFDTEILRSLQSREIRGLIVEGTGLGHVSSKTVDSIRELVKNSVFVGITSQCIWGHVDLNVYETGIDLTKAGAVQLGNMLSETAFVKLCWALGNFSPERTKNLMTTNLVGETTERIPLRFDRQD